MESRPVTPVADHDLTRQHESVRDEVGAAIDRVLQSGVFSLGAAVEAFERQYADYCGAKHCLGVANGTAAVHLAVAACGIGPGDEVITTAHTYVGTGFAVSYTGATPVFVDIDPDSYNMDASLVEGMITPRSKAIVPVHMHGQPVDMDPLLEVAREHGLWVIEDASQSHGATYKGRKVGSLGHIAAFDCYPHKNLGAYGDAACITVNSDELHDQVRLLRNMGLSDDGHHRMVGFHQRLDDIQAAVLSVKLRYLNEWNRKRQQLAALYDRLLADLPLVTPQVSAFATHVYYTYVVRTPRRDDLKEHLAAQGIASRVSYHVPVPLEPAYQSLGYAARDVPIAARYSEEWLCLPMFPELTESEVRRVAAAIREFFAV
jgi:dTDP-4-amino-4,6-dideoxygalactose transaminase